MRLVMTRNFLLLLLFVGSLPSFDLKSASLQDQIVNTHRTINHYFMDLYNTDQEIIFLEYQHGNKENIPHLTYQFLLELELHIRLLKERCSALRRKIDEKYNELSLLYECEDQLATYDF